jgi:dTDP-4-dehydrorhamnose reductase
MKTVILGAAGQLGQQLGRFLPGDVIALGRADADLTKPADLRRILGEQRPGIVVNAAGYTQVDCAESDAAQAFAVNAHGVRDLAAICRDVEATLVHISTDYVFGRDAIRNTPYNETDVPGPVNVYGQSKLAGEEYVRALCPRHFILRTCGIYARGHSNFVETMLRKADEGSSVQVVEDQICTPTSVVDLARALRELLVSQAYGLYHLTNAGSCSWHEFARTILEMTKKSVTLIPITSEQYDSPARRPRYSVLSNARWSERGFTPLRSWQAAIQDYLGSRSVIPGRASGAG